MTLYPCPLRPHKNKWCRPLLNDHYLASNGLLRRSQVCLSTMSFWLFRHVVTVETGE